MDIVFAIANVEGDFDPSYYDLFGKAFYADERRIADRAGEAGQDVHEYSYLLRACAFYGCAWGWANAESFLDYSERVIVGGCKFRL